MLVLNGEKKNKDHSGVLYYKTFVRNLQTNLLRIRKFSPLISAHKISPKQFFRSFSTRLMEKIHGSVNLYEKNSVSVLQYRPLDLSSVDGLYLFYRYNSQSHLLIQQGLTNQIMTKQHLSIKSEMRKTWNIILMKRKDNLWRNFDVTLTRLRFQIQ